MRTNEIINEIVSWLDNNYNQESENYDIFTGSKPEVIPYDEHIAISLWSCGAIVCINDLLYFIEEDDGNWYVHSDEYHIALQSCFSIGWADSFVKALTDLKEYVKEHGTPVYYSGTNVICHYTL